MSSIVVTAELQGGTWVTHDVGSVQDEDDYLTLAQVTAVIPAGVPADVQHNGKTVRVPVYQFKPGSAYVALDDIFDALVRP